MNGGFLQQVSATGCGGNPPCRSISKLVTPHLETQVRLGCCDRDLYDGFGGDQCYPTPARADYSDSAVNVRKMLHSMSVCHESSQTCAKLFTTDSMAWSKFAEDLV